MAHVCILRECPSFVRGDKLILGTHEQIEDSIAKSKYPFNSARKGYCIPNGSEFKFMWYRVKKECIPEFLRDLHITNLNPKHVPFKTWFGLFLPDKICVKWKLYPWFWGKMGKAKLWLMLLFRIIPFLKGADSLQGQGKKFTKNWNYNFFIGYIPDGDRGFGEEL